MNPLWYPLVALGWVWSMPLHGLFGILLMFTVYRPQRITFYRGAVVCVVAKLIPEGIDRTGDGDYDDPEDFRTGGQTHGPFMFIRADQVGRPDLIYHEWVHVVQCWVLGGILHPLLYGLSYAINKLRGMDMAKAYRQVWQERQAYRLQAKFREARR